MKLTTVFFGLLILAGTLFGGAKGYIYYRVSTELDKMIETVSPFVQIKYRGISSSFEGSIAVENISIYPLTSDDEITIEAAQMRGEGLQFLYQLVAGGFQNKLPENFGLRVQGFSIPLGGDLAASYARMLESAKQASVIQDSDGCGVMTGLTPDLLGALGFYAIIMDASLGIEFDPSAGQAEMLLGFDMRDVGYSKMSMLLVNVPQSSGMLMGAQQPQLSEMTATYQIDPGFVAKAQKYCADLRGLTVDSFVESMLNMDKMQLAQQLGFVPGHGLLTAIKSFIKNPKEISFSIHPSEAIDPAHLSFYKPEDLPEILNLELAINGEAVADLSYSLPDSTRKDSSSNKSGFVSQLPEVGTIFSPRVKQSGKLKKQKLTKEYLPTPVTELYRYLDKNVLVHIDQENAVRKGALKAISQDMITIKQRLSGGDMTVNVPLKQILRVDVFRLPD